ncbi:MAG: phosphoribosylanthranilate isomerase [Deltaproteobacteria bacterium]|nr:phosphoribosylanthranilate isomerase [Deltaproteobacteria bacterium]NCP01947.1 phosphoribosylanthranilate isomerase [Deltaproteobacteria bacterium]NCP78389.1 phosphoribosylanthranilate isomerase [Desulfuromonadales bacterium]
MRVRVKICGITTVEDALAAVAAGADALGFVFYPPSPRAITTEQAAAIIAALPPFVTSVGLFVNQSRDLIEQTATFCGLDLLQLHGDESAEDCLIPGRRVIKALRVKDATSLQRAADYRVCGLLLDAWQEQLYGGSGQSFDWALLKEFALRQPVILAGGLTPHNVAAAVETVRPYAVDVSSGVEVAPGKKDHAKLAEFIRQVKTVG